MTADSAPPNRLFAHILWGIGLGIVVGLFFGEAVHPLGFVSSGFIRLLQVNVLPYLLGSLIAGLGRRGTAEMKIIARYGVALLLFVWALALMLVVVCPLALPGFSGVPVFGTDAEPTPIDWLDLYIPANLFYALTNNLIPAVVLFGILAGVALGQMDERKIVCCESLDVFNEAMARVSRLILRITPFGLFAVAAVTAGEIRFEDLLRLEVWLHYYAGGAFILTLWVLPALVARFTPVPHVHFLNEHAHRHHHRGRSGRCAGGAAAHRRIGQAAARRDGRFAGESRGDRQRNGTASVQLPARRQDPEPGVPAVCRMVCRQLAGPDTIRPPRLGRAAQHVRQYQRRHAVPPGSAAPAGRCVRIVHGLQRGQQPARIHGGRHAHRCAVRARGIGDARKLPHAPAIVGAIPHHHGRSRGGIRDGHARGVHLGRCRRRRRAWRRCRPLP